MPIRPPLPRRALAAPLLVCALLAPAPALAGFRVDTTLDTPDAAIGDRRCEDAAGRCSLRAAIQEGNARGRAWIRLRRDTVYTLTLAGTGEDAAATGDLDVTGRIRIRGAGAVIDATGLDRIFDVHADGELRVRRLTLTGGEAPDGEHGGAVRNTGLFDAKRSLVSDSSAPGAGGAGGGLYNDGGALRVLRSTVMGNSAAEAGGGLAADGGLTVVVRSDLLENQSGLDGGGLHATGSGELWIWRSDLADNTAARSGGGAWVGSPSDVYVYRALFARNEAQGAATTDGGGALYSEADVWMLSSSFSDNEASGAAGGGGGLRVAAGRLEIVGSRVEENDASDGGGGMDVSGGRAFVYYSLLGANVAGGDGGGLRVGPGAATDVYRSHVLSNDAAGAGGGLWCSATGTLDVDRTRIEDNGAPTGADVFNEPPGGDFTIDGDPVAPG